MANENDNKLVTLADLGEAYGSLNTSKKNVQTAVSDPIASGTAVSFIDSVSQDVQGVITPTKKTIPDATQSASGLMSANDKKKLDNVFNIVYGTSQNIPELTELNGTYWTPGKGFIYGQLVKDDDTVASNYQLTVGGVIAVRYHVSADDVVFSSFCIPVDANALVEVIQCTNMYFASTGYIPKFLAF